MHLPVELVKKHIQDWSESDQDIIAILEDECTGHEKWLGTYEMIFQYKDHNFYRVHYRYCPETGVTEFEEYGDRVKCYPVKLVTRTIEVERWENVEL